MQPELKLNDDADTCPVSVSIGKMFVQIAGPAPSLPGCRETRAERIARMIPSIKTSTTDTIKMVPIH